MIRKYFKIICDYCACTINDYHNIKPSNRELQLDGTIIYDKKHFCNGECKELFKDKMSSEKTRKAK